MTVDDLENATEALARLAGSPRLQHLERLRLGGACEEDDLLEVLEAHAGELGRLRKLQLSLDDYCRRTAWSAPVSSARPFAMPIGATKNSFRTDT